MAKKYVVVESGWDIDAHPFTFVSGPLEFKEAKEIFDSKLMSQLGVDKEDEEDVEDFQREYAKSLEYDDYCERYLLSMQALEA